MGLFQKAVETYDAHSAYIGKQLEGHRVLAPVGHAVKNAEIEITLNEDGSFHSAVIVDKSEPKIVIPATEEAESRTGTAIRPYPLCDQLCYLAPYNEAKYRAYVAQLTDWTNSDYGHPMLHPILAYVKGGTILRDLSNLGLIKLDDKGKPKDEKLMVRWRVSGMGAASGSCWSNKALVNSFIAWYSAQEKCEKQLCMITGEIAVPIKHHPKNIVPSKANAKLISINDTKGFTYLGRFTDDSQAATISYQASQKVHNTLQWLVAEQGINEETREQYGGRTFLCWNPEGKKTCPPTKKPTA